MTWADWTRGITTTVAQDVLLESVVMLGCWTSLCVIIRNQTPPELRRQETMRISMFSS